LDFTADIFQIDTRGCHIGGQQALEFRSVSDSSSAVTEPFKPAPAFKGTIFLL
jgi:hypothetical protein